MRQQMYQLLRCLGDPQRGGLTLENKAGMQAKARFSIFWSPKKKDFGFPRGVLGEVLRGILGHKNR